MKKLYTLILLVIIGSSVNAQSSEYYYWHNGEKQFLRLNDEKTYLLLDFVASSDTLANTLRTDKQKIERNEKLVLSATIISPQSVNHSLNRSWAVIKGRATQLDLSTPEIIYHAPFFYSKSGKELGLSHLFYVKLRKTDDVDLLVEMAQKNNVEVLGSNRFMPLWYILSCDKNSKGNALEMANWFNPLFKDKL